MKVTGKFENGLSIVQLEERFEMMAAAEGDRTRTTSIEGHYHEGTK